ncbi:MAG: DNA-binding response regulator [Gammaproteobacteria bacterium]|nr:MAG: DNA-binding response regulator [Gammaproteobacteria bacterium]
MATQLLLVDDDRELCEMLVAYLRPEGYAPSVAPDGPAALAQLPALQPDIVVLDIGLPGMDGFEVLREIRRQSAVPVIMLTARGDETDRIVGLEIGADDYLPKPFNPRELLARLRAVLRRSGAGGMRPEARLQVAELVLDPGARCVTLADRPLTLTATEFAVLEALARRAGRVVSKADLSRSALGRPLQPLDRSLDTHISNLRRKLGPLPDGQPRIRTLRGRGYQLVLPGNRA